MLLAGPVFVGTILSLLTALCSTVFKPYLEKKNKILACKCLVLILMHNSLNINNLMLKVSNNQGLIYTRIFDEAQEIFKAVLKCPWTEVKLLLILLFDKSE